MGRHNSESNPSSPDWFCALLPLLLAAAAVVPFLGQGIFDVDEAATLIISCARHIGECTLAEAARASASWSEHPWGLALSFSQWGRLVGWSEFAVRALPWLTGLLTLAWVYRIGRELFSRRVAFTAMLLLSTSVLFLTYMHIARFNGPTMLSWSVLLWGYWRVNVMVGSPRKRDWLAMLLGATAILYSHYFAALAIPATGLFHLLFVRKGRRWWLTVAVLVLAVLIALPQIPDFLLGMHRIRFLSKELTGNTLHAPEVMSLFLRYLSSDLLNFRLPVAILLLLVPPLILFVATRARAGKHRHTGAARYIALIFALLLSIMLAANEWVGVVHPTGVRNLAVLWPAGVLLISLGLTHPKFRLLRPGPGVVLVVAVALSGIHDFVREGPLVQTSWDWRHHDTTVPAMTRVVQELGRDVPRTRLVVDYRLFGAIRQREFYTGAHDGRFMNLTQETTSGELVHHARDAHSVIFLLQSSREQELNLQEHVDLFLQRHWIKHLAWSEGGVTLIRFVTPFSTILIDRNELAYERDIRMVGSGLLREEGSLRFLAHLSSRDAQLLANYSLAVHIIDPRRGQRVAQGDVGVGPGTYVRIQSEVDISALPPGDYEIHVALYDWRTGERLSARDPDTGVVSDMHVLHRFHTS